MAAQSSLLASARVGDAARRAGYAALDIVLLLRNVIAASGVDRSQVAKFDENADGILQPAEVLLVFEKLVQVDLLECEVSALRDLLDNSLGTVRLYDFQMFLFDHSKPRVAAPGRLNVARGTTVTTVALAPDGRRVACGGMDAKVTVYDLCSSGVMDPLFEKIYPKPVAAVALGRSGLAAGGFSPGDLDWIPDVAARPPEEPTPVWRVDADVHARDPRVLVRPRVAARRAPAARRVRRGGDRRSVRRRWRSTTSTASSRSPPAGPLSSTIYPRASCCTSSRPRGSV